MYRGNGITDALRDELIAVRYRYLQPMEKALDIVMISSMAKLAASGEG